MDNMVGTRIHEMRNELGLTPKTIKELTGIGSGHLSELENGKKLPSTPTLIKLSEIFNCTTDWILFGITRNNELPCSNLTTPESELDTENIIGSRLKERRKELGLTLVQIHDKTGVSTGILSAWERGEKLPSAPSLMKLSDVLECSIDWILFGEQHFEKSKNSECVNSPYRNLTSIENELLSYYGELDPEDQEEIMDIIKLKLKRKDGRRKSSTSDEKSHVETA